MKQNATFSVDKTILGRLDKMSKENGVNKSKVVEECLKDLLGMKSLIEKWKKEV